MRLVEIEQNKHSIDRIIKLLLAYLSLNCMMKLCLMLLGILDFKKKKNPEDSVLIPTETYVIALILVLH